MTNRQNWFPPISKQPTPEELARHLRLIYQALNDHDNAIVELHGQTSPAPKPSIAGDVLRRAKRLKVS
jgi:hypothetical protein